MSARTKARRTSRGRRHAPPPPRNRWHRNMEPLPLSREQWRVVLHRTKRRLPAVTLDPLVEHVDWERSGSTRTAELNFRRPLSRAEVGLIFQGDTVAFYVDEEATGTFRPVWRMVVATPNDQLQDGVVNVALAASLDAMNKSKRTWKYVVGKKRRRPWRADEIVRDAAKRAGVPLGRIARGHHPFRRVIRKKASFGALVSWLYGRERHYTGRRFDVDTSSGRLEVLELTYPSFMYVLGKHLLDGTVQRSTSNLATALVVTSTSKKGKRRHSKVRVKVRDRRRERRYGYIEKHVDHPGLHSPAAARAWGKAHLARMTGPHADVTFSMPGIVWLDRGNAALLYLPEVGLYQIVFVKSVRHTLSAGSYEMEVTVGYDDPYRDAAKERAKKKRDEVARRRKRAKERAARAAHPKPKRAARH